MLSLKYDVKCDVIAQMSSTTGIRSRSDGYCPRYAGEVLPLDTAGEVLGRGRGESTCWWVYQSGRGSLGLPAGGGASQGGECLLMGVPVREGGEVPAGGGTRQGGKCLPIALDLWVSSLYTFYLLWLQITTNTNYKQI